MEYYSHLSNGKFRKILSCVVSYLIVFSYALFSLPKNNFSRQISASAASTSSLANPQSSEVGEEKANQTSLASTTNYTIFMNTPTYAFEIDSYLYFIDNADKLLKALNTEKKTFESKNLSLKLFTEIYDATFCGEYLIVLGKTDKSFDFESDPAERSRPESEVSDVAVEIIDAKNFKVKATLFNEKFTDDYQKISSTTSKSQSDTNLHMVLTPIVKGEDGSETSSPLVITALKVNTEEFTPSADNVKVCEVKFGKNDNFNTVKASLFKFLILTADETNIRLLYIFGSSLGYVQFSAETLKGTEATINDYSSKATNFDSSDPKTVIVSSSLMNFELDGGGKKDYLLITYTTTKDEEDKKSESYSWLYNITFGASTEENKVDAKLKIDASTENYIITKDNYIYFPNIDNAYDRYISRVEIKKSSDGDTLTSEFDNTTFRNPEIKYTYYEPENYKYLKVKKSTSITSKPWSSESRKVILKENDWLIVVADASIEGEEEDTPIEDFYFVMYTDSNDNTFGFVKIEDDSGEKNVELQSEIRVETEFGNLKKFKVLPNTQLYSLPTKITALSQIEELNNKIPSVLMTIADNIPVEPIDLICGYVSNGSRLIKVKVNGNQEGYIEYDSIVRPKEQNDFVITNSSIKSSGTQVYLNPNQSSEIIGVLDKGYRVQIVGPRSNSSGYTCIKYNDEYGNEFTGYIRTDFIQTDTWSMLQIIGFVLIAINIGLLILILYFKHTRIGFAGQIYDKSKKSTIKKDPESTPKNFVDN